jgi:hypothetical protein
MTPNQIKADYRAKLAATGETITIRRYTGTGTNRPKIDRTVLARVTGYGPTELVGTIQQGDRLIIALADDITQPTTDSPPQALTLPIVTSDKIVLRGKELQIIASDDSTRRVQGVLIALEIQARG